MLVSGRVLGFACLMPGKSSKNSHSNEGLMVMNPMIYHCLSLSIWDDSIRDLFQSPNWRSRLQPVSSGHVELTIPKRSPEELPGKWFRNPANHDFTPLRLEKTYLHVCLVIFVGGVFFASLVSWIRTIWTIKRNLHPTYTKHRPPGKNFHERWKWWTSIPGTPNNQFKMDIWWFPTI